MPSRNEPTERLRRVTTNTCSSVPPAANMVTSADKRKSFYEDVVQSGTMQDTGIGTPYAEIAAACRPSIARISRAQHEFLCVQCCSSFGRGTPHLHIDYILIVEYKQGVDTQNGIAQALKEMGYGTGKDAIARWREAECKILTEICSRHGIQIAAPEKSRGSLTVEQYKEYAKSRNRWMRRNKKSLGLTSSIKRKPSLSAKQPPPSPIIKPCLKRAQGR